MGLIVAVTGGRDFSDIDHVFRTLDRVHKRYGIRWIIEGGQTGADYFSHLWAEKREIESRRIEAQWEKWKSAAGPIRNQRIIDDYPDRLVAFPGGKGTRDMIERAEVNGIPILYSKNITR